MSISATAFAWIDYKTELTDKAYAARRAVILHDLDRMLGELMASRELKDARIALVSFSPPYSPSWNQLTPIVVYPAGISGAAFVRQHAHPGLDRGNRFCSYDPSPDGRV